MPTEPGSESREIDSEIEAALRALAPARSHIDRDKVMFAAGMAAARHQRPRLQPWPAVAAALALVALGEGALLANRPAARVVVIREQAPTQPPTPVDPPTPRPVAVASSRGGPAEVGPTAQDRLADQLIRYGLDGLPPTPAVAAWGDRKPDATSSRSLLQQELRNASSPGDPS